MEAAETSLISVRRARLAQLEEEGNRRASRALRLLDDPGRFTTTIDRVGELAAVVGAVAAWRFGSGIHPHYGGPAGLVCFITAFFFLGNIVPKTLASMKPDWLALAMAGWIDRLSALIYPAVNWFQGLAAVAVRAGGGEVQDRSPYVTEEEIKIFAEQGVEAGELEEEEKEMIHSILEFTDTVVREVMVPRIDITAVDVDDSLEDVLEAILKEGHSRIPVYEGSIDNIIGILHARDVLNEIARAQGILSPPHRFGDASPGPMRPGFSLRQMRADSKLRAPYFIPENKKISELLKELRMSKTPIAIVVDEYGGTAGLVTIEDLLEEIVGEIMDEWDVEEEMIRPVDENCVIFDARVPVEDVNEMLSVDLPDDEFETIGGFVFGLFGKLPSAGDTISYKDLDFTVEKADSHRIMEVKACRAQRADRTGPGKQQADDRQPGGPEG